MNETPWMDELSAARTVARAAGAAILYYHRHPDCMQSREKAGGMGPITLADLGSSALISRTLNTLFPDDFVLSEEEPDPSGRQAAERLWIIDPLDGTKEFSAGRGGEFCVIVGLAVRRPNGFETVVGAIYAPTTDTLYSAAEGAGAWKQVGDEPEVRMSVAPSVSAAEATVVVTRSHRTPALERILSALGASDTQARGSALKAMAVAEGSAHLYVRPSPLWEWDLAGAEIICREAGAVVTDATGIPLVWNKSHPLIGRGVVTAPGGLHAEAMEVVADLVRPLIKDDVIQRG